MDEQKKERVEDCDLCERMELKVRHYPEEMRLLLAGIGHKLALGEN